MSAEPPTRPRWPTLPRDAAAGQARAARGARGAGDPSLSARLRAADAAGGAAEAAKGAAAAVVRAPGRVKDAVVGWWLGARGDVATETVARGRGGKKR